MAILEDIIEDDNKWPSKEDRMLGAVCYAPFGCFAPILMQKQSEFLSFHTKQGGIIFGAFFILNLIPIPYISWLLFLAYLWLASFAGWKAFNGEMYSYGFIDALFEKFKK